MRNCPGHFQTVFLAVCMVSALVLLPQAILAGVPTLSDTTVYWDSQNTISSAKVDSAQLGATITSDGGESISERGIVWSTSDTIPEIGDPGVTQVVFAGVEVSIFSETIDLSSAPASHIYFQGYATNPSGTIYSGVSNFYTELDPLSVTSITGTSYFEFTVNFPIPDSDIVGTDAGVVVVVRLGNISRPPYDGTAYIPNSRFGLAPTTDPSCFIYCEAVVANEPAVSTGGSGSVKVTGLKEDLTYSIAVFTYKGSGAGISGINYNQTTTSTSQATSPVPLEGTSHNELNVASGPGGTMTNADCTTCHGSHHNDPADPLLPRLSTQEDKCRTCHFAGGANDNFAMHASDTLDCGTCHTMHMFRTEELYSYDHSTSTSGFNLSFVRANMAKYFNVSNGFIVDAIEPTVFQDQASHFAYPVGDTDPVSGKYNGVCQTCHTANTHHTQTANDGHHIGEICTTCHTHKGEFLGGGHPADFDTITDTLCLGCHTITTSVLVDAHGDGTTADCTLCHTASIPGLKIGARGLGDATNAAGTAAGGTWTGVSCTQCHDITDTDLSVTTYGEMHHGHANATGGDCIFCHQPDVGQAGDRSTLSMPTNLPCNWCHLWWPNNKGWMAAATDNGYNTTGGKVQIYSLNWDPNGTTTRTFAASGVLATHAVSTTTTPPITDYAACFACHGASAATKGGGFQIKPFHGFGPAVTGWEPLSGDSGVVNVNIEFYGGPETTGQNQAARSISWHPGFAAFNYLGVDVRPVTGIKQFATDTRRAHDLDLSANWTALGTSVPSGAFTIPWDNYDSGIVVGPGTSNTLNSGGQTGSFTKPTIVPLVPLSLPTSITP